VDSKCRAACEQSRDCLDNQVCVSHVCADMDEVQDATGDLPHLNSVGGWNGVDDDGGPGLTPDAGGDTVEMADAATPDQSAADQSTADQSMTGSTGSDAARESAVHDANGSTVDVSTIDAPPESGTTTGSDGSTVGDPCVPGDGGYAPEVVSNDDRNSATPLPFMTTLVGCLQVATDVDYYQFTTPPAVQGGFVMVTVGDVGSTNQVYATLYSASTNGSLGAAQSSGNGASANFWFAAKGESSFRIGVTSNYSHIGPYTITATWQEAVEPGEPNNDRAHAVPMQVGTPVQGLFFSGYADDTVLTDQSDYFKVTLPTGMSSLKLTNVASDMRGDLKLLDTNGVQLSDTGSSTYGADLVVTPNITTAGDYYIVIASAYSGLSSPKGFTTKTLPMWATQPYTLTVTTP
jgi:hypothetical protein